MEEKITFSLRCMYIKPKLFKLILFEFILNFISAFFKFSRHVLYYWNYYSKLHNRILFLLASGYS